jgi:DNA repair exonuclease SbcCD ATPase subunit
MVANGINRGELVSRVREFLRGLSREEIKRLSREEFARAIGVDPLNTPSEYKWELARILYSEFKLPYRKICELLAMSARDVAKAVKGGVKAGEAVEETTMPKVDVEVQAKVIELVRSGEARNPNDLVLKLKIPLDIAEQLFNRIVENEKLTLEPTIIAVVRIEKSLRTISRYAERLERLEEKIKEYEERAQRIVKKLDEALNDKMKTIQSTKERVEELGKEIFKLGTILAGMGMEVATFKDLLGRVQQLMGEVSKFDKELRKLSEEVKLMDRRLLSVATEVERLNEFKEKVEKIIKAR